jgi:hypothetical protein
VGFVLLIFLVFGGVRIADLISVLCCVVLCLLLVSRVIDESVSGLSILDCPFGFL